MSAHPCICGCHRTANPTGDCACPCGARQAEAEELLAAARERMAMDDPFAPGQPTPVDAETVKRELVEALSSCKFMSHAEAADALLGHPVLGKLLKGER